MPTPTYVPLAYRVDGRCIPLKWKAWINDDGSVDWELWAILQALVPKRNWQGKHIRAQKVLSADFGGWLMWASRVRGSEAVVRPSAKSLRSLGKPTDDRTHDTVVLSTYGVLSLFAWAMAFRKTRINRECAEQCFRSFLLVTYPELLDMDFDMPSYLATAQDECDEDAEVGMCCHLRRLQGLQSEGDAVDQARDFLRAAFMFDGKCQATTSLIDDLATTLSSGIDQHLAGRDFPSDPVLHAERRKGTKRHRTHDEDLKKEVVRRASRGQASVGSVARATGLAKQHGSVKWHLGVLPSYLAASWRSWRDCAVLSLSADASKFGMPAEETMAYALTDGWSSGWLPPQVWRVHAQRIAYPHGVGSRFAHTRDFSLI